jgi:hypothetical protein
MKPARRMTLVGALVAAWIALSTGGAARAQTSQPPGSAIKPLAPHVEVTISPGGSTQGELPFRFEGPATAKIRLSAAPWPLDEAGNPSAPRGSEAPGWLTLEPAELEARPGEASAAHFRLELPASVGPGDHTLQVRLVSDQPASEASILIVATVPGSVQARPVLGELAAFRGSLAGGPVGPSLPGNLLLSSGGPLQLQALLRNDGEVRFGGQAAVTLTNPLGQQLARIAVPSAVVLPGQTESLEAYWGSPPAIGLYAARLELQAGGETLARERWLLILPWQQIGAALLFALVAWMLLVRRPRDQRRAQIAAELREARGEVSEPGIPSRSRVAATASSDPASTVPAQSLAESAVARSSAPTSAWSESSSGPDVAELMRWGQQAARGGDRLVGHRLFVRALESEPENVEAWLWRAATTDQAKETIYCLERALELDPGNSRARRGLEECRRRLAQGVAGRSEGGQHAVVQP